MINYIRRLLKFLAYIVFFFVLILGILPLISSGRSMADSFGELFSEQRFIVIFILLMAYSLVYPIINFINIKRHLNGSFDDNRSYFEEAFDMLKYIKVSESGSQIVYRKKSKLNRAMYFWEDQVIVDFSDNPVIISGMRKAIYRINRFIEQSMMKDKPL